MKLPIIIVNFKTYQTGTGQQALEMAQICQQVAQETGAAIAIAVDAVDLKQIAQTVDIPVLAQHVDGVSFGSHTGHILPEAIKEAGAAGTLINHSEDQYNDQDLQTAIARAKELQLTTVVCAPTPQRAQEIAKYHPDIIAVEPPELIGTGISVTQAQPEVVTNTTESITNIPILCGAGVNTKEDVQAALKLGTQGVLLASGVLKAENPKEVLIQLAQSLN